MLKRTRTGIDIITSVIFNGQEHFLIDMKITRSDMDAPFSLENFEIERGEIQLGDYVRSILATWSIDQNDLILKEITFKKNAFTVYPGGTETTETQISGEVMETMHVESRYNFTGRLRVAREHVLDQRFSDPEQATFYKMVVDLTFHDNKLVGVIDRSRDVEELRLALKRGIDDVPPLIGL